MSSPNIQLSSNIKLIKSGAKPTTDSLPIGFMAFGKVDEDGLYHLFGNADGVIQDYIISNYDLLANKPMINGHVLTQYTTTEDLGLGSDLVNLPVEKFYTIVTNLVQGESLTLTLPTAVFGRTSSPKVFVDGILVASGEDVGFTAGGMNISFVPSASKSNAEVKVFYPGNPNELPRNEQYIDVEFEIDEPNTTITSAMDMRLLSEGAPVSIDWGDGNSEVVASDATYRIYPSHTYMNPGKYVVKIREDFGQMYICIFNSQSVKCVSKVIRYEGTAITSLGSIFASQPKAIQFESGFQFKTPNVTSLGSAFELSGVEEVPDGIFDHLSKVTTLAKTFDKSQIRKLQSCLFDSMAGTVTTINAIARQCPNLVELGESLFRDFISLTTAAAAFQSSPNLSVVGDDLLHGCVLLTSTSTTFQGTGAFVVGPGMLEGCVSLVDVSSMFYQSKIETLPRQLFKYCPNLKNITALLRTASGIISIPGDLFINNPLIETINLAFNGMTSCVDVGAGLLAPFIANLTNATSAFQGSAAFTTSINDLITSDIREDCVVTSMFYGCTKMTGSGLDAISKVPELAAHGTFLKNCTSLSDWASIPTGWK